MRRLSLLAALVLTASLALTGCGSEPESEGVASGGTSQPEASTGGGDAAAENLSQDEMGVKFAQCLRENGLDVKDPEPGKGVMLKFGPESGMSREKVEQAMEACRKYNPQADSKPNPEQEANGRKFAACMRENGVEKFPDPKPGQRGIQIDKEAGSDPDLEKAQAACQSILAGR
ncbi:hypothetical protein BWI15_37035 [Kribbella sp. ALI-6-A]|uniref:hypothetical protein n=1 Tax=Kribbella sp. ALI-6-A TaxID=1933817 RepID=UPI00097C8B07|nr:hypothetical protein [Kribbella sp. ALI-6-A]ONI68592.1 hypothetical protein BWI15_37035 [Kribbella sp. ALI-6-A]